MINQIIGKISLGLVRQSFLPTLLRSATNPISKKTPISSHQGLSAQPRSISTIINRENFKEIDRHRISIKWNFTKTWNFTKKIVSALGASYLGWKLLIYWAERTDIGRRQLDKANEKMLKITSPCLFFEENSWPENDNMPMVFFRGESLDIAKRIIDNHLNIVRLFYYPRRNSFYSPKVNHQILDKGVPSGWSRSLISVTSDISVAAVYNRCIVFCVPRKVAPIYDQIVGEKEKSDCEMVSTSIENKQILGILILDDKRHPNSASFIPNPNYNGTDNFVIPSEATSYLALLPETDPNKERLLARTKNNLSGQLFYVNHEYYDERAFFELTMFRLLKRSKERERNRFYVIDPTNFFYGPVNEKKAATNSPDKDSNLIVSLSQKLTLEPTFSKVLNGPGDLYKDSENRMFFIKTVPVSIDNESLKKDSKRQLCLEHILGNMYEHLGMAATDTKPFYFIQNGSVYLAFSSDYKLLKGVDELKDDEEPFLREAAKGLLVDIWLGNFDILLSGSENLLAIPDKGGKFIPYRKTENTSWALKPADFWRDIFEGSHLPIIHEAQRDFDKYFESDDPRYGKVLRLLKNDPELLREAIEALSSFDNENLGDLICPIEKFDRFKNETFASNMCTFLYFRQKTLIHEALSFYKKKLAERKEKEKEIRHNHHLLMGSLNPVEFIFFNCQQKSKQKPVCINVNKRSPSKC